MFPLEKCCYVVPLKRGILILAIIDLIFLVMDGSWAAYRLSKSYNEPWWSYVAVNIILLIHLIGCIVLLISLRLQKKVFSKMLYGNWNHTHAGNYSSNHTWIYGRTHNNFYNLHLFVDPLCVLLVLCLFLVPCTRIFQ